MGLTGLIFAAIAVAWLAYLVPSFLRRRAAAQADEDPAEQFSDSMRIVRRGAAPLVDADGAELDAVEVSTPLTRRAAIVELGRLATRATLRRRRVLVVLAVAVTAVLVCCVLNVLAWFWMAVPLGLLLTFVVLSRVSVVAMRRQFEQRYAQITAGGDESTIYLRRSDLAAVAATTEQAEPSQQLTGPLSRGTSTGALWDPLPIAQPTYVSKPLVPRTVRTIDLAGPDVTSSARGSTLGQVPPTADAPIGAVTEAPEREAEVVVDDPATQRRAAGA